MQHKSVPISDHEDPQSLSRYHDDDEETPPVKPYTPAQLKAIARQGWTCVIGGVILHSMLGGFNAWGSISIYAAKSMGIKSADRLALVFPLQFLVSNLVLSFGVKMAQKCGYKTIILMGGVLNALTTLAGSFVPVPLPFVLLYGTMSGVSYGTIYMLPISCGWKYFPFDRRRVSAIILAGYSIGACCFTLVSYLSHVDFTQYMRLQALCYLVLTLIGACLVRFPEQLNLELQPQLQQHQPPLRILVGLHGNQCETLHQGIRSRPFTLLLVLLTLATCGSMWLMNLYKVFGLEVANTSYKRQVGLSDWFLTQLGAGSILVHGLTRTLWIRLMERIGIKKLYILTMGLHLVVCLLQLTIGIYSVFVFLMINCGGGMLACLPYATTKLFGNKVGPAIYGVVSIGVGILHLPILLVTITVHQMFGFGGILKLMLGINFVGLGLSFRLRDQYIWSTK